MPAENTKERDFARNCTLPAFQPFLLVPGFSADALSRRAADYITGYFLPGQLYFIQMENCYRFFLNVKGRFALPIRDWQASVIKVAVNHTGIRPY
jgi:hypothetical protein